MKKTMKKYSILLGAAFGLFALASCQKEVDVNIPESENAAKHIPFVLKANVPETRTTIDASTWEMAWENGDIIYAVTTDEEWGAPYSDETPNLESIAEFTYGENGFSTTQEISDGKHTFNFLYTGGAQKSYHRGAGSTFQLYTNQSMDADNPTANLKKYDALAGQVTATTPTTFANVSMAHLFTLMKVTLKNKTGAEITATKFEISAENANLYGIFNVAFGEKPAASYSRLGGSKLAVTITNGTIENDGTLDVYFVMAPLSDYSGNITFSVTDNEGNAYTKTNNVSGVSFAAGTYNTASHTLKTSDTPVEPETSVWTLVENVNELEDGMQVVIANSSHTYAISTTQANNNRPAAAITSSGNNITINSADVQIITLVASGDNWRLKVGNDQYLYAASNSSNHLKTESLSTVGDNGKFAISISSDYEASITAQGANSRNKLCYNPNTSNNNPIFTCYGTIASTYEAPAIYKRYVSDGKSDAEISYSPSSATFILGQTFSQPTLSNPHGLTEISYESSNTAVAEVTDAGVITIKGSGTVTITASWEEQVVNGVTYREGDTTFTLTVNSASNHYYVKVTSTSGITDGDYLIVYENGRVAFNGGLESLDAVSNTIDVTVSDGKIVADNNTNAAKFTINVTSGTILSASGLYIGVSANSNGLKSSEVSSEFTNSFSIDEDQNAVISAVFEGSNMTLRYNKAANQNRFRYYKSGQEGIQLYKYQ